MIGATRLESAAEMLERHGRAAARRGDLEFAAALLADAADIRAAGLGHLTALDISRAEERSR